MSEIYPLWWDTDITIYNKYIDPITQLITWFRATRSGCFWKYVGDKITVGQTVLETNNIICRIPEDANFKEHHEWISLPNDIMSAYYTLSVGDIIVKGEVDDEINEYQTGHRATDLVKKYKASQGCMTVEELAINVGAGRCNPHYYVKGI